MTVKHDNMTKKKTYLKPNITLFPVHIKPIMAASEPEEQTETDCMKPVETKENEYFTGPELDNGGEFGDDDWD